MRVSRVRPTADSQSSWRALANVFRGGVDVHWIRAQSPSGGWIADWDCDGGAFFRFTARVFALSAPGVNDITVMLQAVGQGDPAAADRLMEAVYAELRRVAAAKMGREFAAGTLQPTALVHEAWLRLGGDEQTTWQNRAHFFGAAAEAMRRILIDRARRRARDRHGGGMERVDVDAIDLPAITLADDHLLALHEALERLAVESPERAELVKLRYFGGLTLQQAAACLGISERTTKRWWTFARAWLHREVRQ